MPSRIEDYAIIADCQSVALVGKNGSLDWLCLPRFDSDACFDHAAAHRDRLGASLDAPARAPFLAYAGTRLERIRTRGRTG